MPMILNFLKEKEPKKCKKIFEGLIFNELIGVFIWSGRHECIHGVVRHL